MDIRMKTRLEELPVATHKLLFKEVEFGDAGRGDRTILPLLILWKGHGHHDNDRRYV